MHVRATEVRFIGKEADRWEEEYYLGLRSGDLSINYGGDPVAGGQAFILLRNAIAAFGKANVATATKIARGTLTKIEAGKPATTPVPLASVITAVTILNEGRSKKEREADADRARLKAFVIESGGLRKAAALAGVDASNLSKRLRGKR